MCLLPFEAPSHPQSHPSRLSQSVEFKLAETYSDSPLLSIFHTVMAMFNSTLPIRPILSFPPVYTLVCLLCLCVHKNFKI